MKQTRPRTLAEFFERDGAPTMAAFAKRLNVSPPYVSMLTAGKRQPSLKLALKIESITGVPASALVSEADARLNGCAVIARFGRSW